MRDGTTITVDDLSRAGSGSEETLSGTSFVVDPVELFTEITTQSSTALVPEITEQGEANVPDSEERLVYVKTVYMMGGYIPTLRDVRSEKRCIRARGKYTRRL